MNVEELLLILNDEIFKLMKKQKSKFLKENELSDLSVNNFFYLKTLKQFGKITVTDLAHHCEITKPSVTAIVNKLIELGYLTKIQSEDDKRVYYLELTDKGNHLVDTVNRSDIDTYKEFTDIIDKALLAEEKEAFRKYLEKIVAEMKKE